MNKGRDSIGMTHITCQECGKALILLSHRHLALHHLTPESYRRKYGMSAGQPLCAQSLSQRRYKLAQHRLHGKSVSAE